MRISLLKCLLVISLLLSFSSCTKKPTYPKEKFEESILKLCKEEYGIDVDVKIIGSTLGVYLPIDGLVDSQMQLVEKSGEKIENVALSIHRAALSTDRPLTLYSLTARDTKTLGAEFNMVGSTYDIIRVRLLDISRGEYHKRILRSFKFNPTVIGEQKIRKLFKDINENSPSVTKIKDLFYPLNVIAKEGTQKIDIINMSHKEISDEEAIFYIKTKEHYDVKPEFDIYKNIFPPGFENEYLILINISSFDNPIKEIVSRYIYIDTEIRERDLRDTFDKYIDSGYLGIDGLPNRELTLDWFLTQTIVRRIRLLFLEDNVLKKNFKLLKLGAIAQEGVLHFRFNFSSTEETPESEKIVFDKLLKTITQVIHRYDFKDFEAVEVMDSASEKRIKVLKKDLEKFRRGKIKIEDLLKTEPTTRP
ncbi:MAG: hypothetical protein ABH848_00875 [Candidatus Omnitrophota bacterium]